MEFDAELLKEFLNESWDNMEKLDQDFVELEKHPEDPQIITRIFRVIHTLKGCSGLLGFGKLEKISHYAEDILSQIREGERSIEPDVITKLLEAADVLKEILTVVEETQAEGDRDCSVLISELKMMASSSGPAPQAKAQGAPPAPSPPAAGTPTTWQVTIILDENEKMPSVRGLVVAERLAEHGTIDELVPDVRKDEDLAIGEPLVVFLQTDKTQGEIKALAMGTSVKSVEVEPVEDLLASAEETAQQREEELASTATTAETTSGTSMMRTGTLLERAEKAIRVDIEVIDRLMNLVGELVLSRNQILQFSATIDNSTFNAACHRISLVTSELQENIMKTRMQPLANVFNRFPRMVRDLATDFEKQVELFIEGKETELDRTLLDAVKDPMVHILRNSMDHGIESPAVREAKGKNPVGMLHIRAFHESGQVNIQISDDGAGINPDKLRENAVRKGILTQPQADALSDRDAINLIFAAGFSTAEKVTNVSGRGVGMDVVRSNIERIGGSVDIQSEVDAGTTITVKIPLTLAIIPTLLVSSCGEKFAIPQTSLVELVCLKGNEVKSKIEMVRNVEVYRLRGELLPLVRLKKVLDLPETNGKSRDYVYIVVLSAGGGQVGLVVDEVFDTEEIVVKPLSRHLKQIPCFAGATILGDGRVSLILDIQGIVTSAGIRMEDFEEEEDAILERRLAEQQIQSDQHSIILFQVGEESQFAIPLGLVNRLEEFTSSEIEMSSGHEVIQYRNDVLPLIRPEHLLQVASIPEPSEKIPVIVFSFEDKYAGLVVSKILDIQEVSSNFSKAAINETGILGTAVINHRNTEFIDIYRVLEMALPEWFSSSGMSQAGSGRHVLLVDDSPFYRTMVLSYLEAAGYVPVEAEHGREALERLENDPEIQIVLTDIDMPEMDGYELMQNLRSSDTYQQIPVVALTSFTDEEHRQKAMTCGADYYLVKLDRAELLKTVGDILKERVSQ